MNRINAQTQIDGFSVVKASDLGWNTETVSSSSPSQDLLLVKQSETVFAEIHEPYYFSHPTPTASIFWFVRLERKMGNSVRTYSYSLNSREKTLADVVAFVEKKMAYFEAKNASL